MAHLSGRLARFGLLLAILVSIVLVPFGLWGEAVEAWTARQMGAAGSSVLMALVGAALLSLDVLLPIPSSMVGAALGAALGALDATLVGAFGLTLGCCLGYLIGSLMGPSVTGRLVQPDELTRARTWLGRHGVLALALLRPVPVLAEVSVIAAGLLRLSPPRVLGVTALANIGLSAVYASLGATASGPVTFVIALGAALAIPAAALLGMRFLHRRAARAEPG